MRKITLENFTAQLGLQGKTEAFFASNWEMLKEKLGDSPLIPESFTKKFYEERKAYFHSPVGRDLYARIEMLLPLLEEFPECWFFARAVEYMDYKVHIPSASGELTVNIPSFGENTPVFYWMVKAGLIPYLRESYQKENIPLSMAESCLETLIGVAEIRSKGNNGIPGCTLSTPSWDRQYAKKQLFRIGRLVYKPLENPWYLPYIYRHKETGELMVFARDNWLLNGKSQMPYLREEPGPEFRKTHFRKENGTISGFSIDPYGNCDISCPKTLPASQWEELVSTSTLIGDIHIPGGAPFTPESILDSMYKAREFLESYSGRKITLFACNSWILNPAWEKLIPNSNIAKFQKEGYLFPGDCCDVEGLGFVFGKSDGDRLAYPQTTSLEKAFHELISKGERLRSGGIFFLPEDLKHYGTSFYRK